MRFSQRYGFDALPQLVQLRDMSRELRVGLWNVLYSQKIAHASREAKQSSFILAVWARLMKRPIDELPFYSHSAGDRIKEYFFLLSWWQVYDVMEFVALNFGDSRFADSVNFVLLEERSGYRLTENLFVSIIDSVEVEEIEEAIRNSPFSSSSDHLKRALELLAKRPSPDLRNSVKEAILAVEAACGEILGRKATLGEALKALEGKIPVHGAFKSAFQKLYGYTSDAEGIRHALLEEPSLVEADARFFLIVCSAFVNYLASVRVDATRG